MKLFEELRDDANREQIALMFADAEIASTNLDLALHTDTAAVKTRQIEEADQMCTFIRERIPVVSLTPDEGEALDAKLAQLEQKLTLLERRRIQS